MLEQNVEGKKKWAMCRIIRSSYMTTFAIVIGAAFNFMDKIDVITMARGKEN